MISNSGGFDASPKVSYSILIPLALTLGMPRSLWH
jgi:hypothetical protein